MSGRRAQGYQCKHPKCSGRVRITHSYSTRNWDVQRVADGTCDVCGEKYLVQHEIRIRSAGNGNGAYAQAQRKTPG